MKKTVKDGSQRSILPHIEDFVNNMVHEMNIALEIQKVAQIEAADVLIFLVEFQWRDFLCSPPLQTV